MLAQQTIGVLVRPALSRAVRIAEVDGNVGRQREPLVPGHLLAPVPCQQRVELVGKVATLARSAHLPPTGCRGSPPWPASHRASGARPASRHSFRGAAQKVSLPMTWHRAILHRGGALPDRDRIGDAPALVGLRAGMPRAADRPARTQARDSRSLLLFTAGPILDHCLKECGLAVGTRGATGERFYKSYVSLN